MLNVKFWLGKNPNNFIFLDTEGKRILREIAILDNKGRVIYQSFVQDHYNNQNIRINLKSLAIIVQEITEILPDKIIVCHNAEHDKNILRNSFRKFNLAFPRLKFICTLQLSQQHYPQSPNYSLSYLAKQLNLKVEGQYFQDNLAHSAIYDTKFTRQLYLYLIKNSTKKMIDLTEIFTPDYQNPFSSSRVDDPFQNHPDYQEIYNSEFIRLKRILTEIKNDKNYQSRGAIIIGEAGTGKTHLIMRIAQQLLERNRLLFIRQPNNADSVLYHTYSRILESFFELVPNRNNTQLEFLIAHSFTKILRSFDSVKKTQQGIQLIQTLEKDCLSLFNLIGTEDNAEKHRKNWEFIERYILDWWANNQHHIGGYSKTILQGIIRYCRYSRLDLKSSAERWLSGNQLNAEEVEKIGLINWQEDLSREEFALEAIRVFGILSKLDEPLIIVFDQLEGLGFPQNRNILYSFGSAVKEIITHVPNSLIILNLFPNRWQQFQEYFDEAVNDRLRQNLIYLPTPSREAIEKILILKAQLLNLNLENIFTKEELEDILSKSSIRKILNRASDYFNYKFYHIPLPEDFVNQTSTIDLEERVKELEYTLAEIAKLVSNFVPKKPDIPVNPTPNPFPINDKDKLPISQPPTPPSTPTIPSNHPLEKQISEYLNNKKQSLAKEYQKPQVISDSDDIGKLKNILETFIMVQPSLEINQLVLGKRKLPEHLAIKNKKGTYIMAFIHLTGAGFAARLGNFNELVVSYPKYKFQLFRDIRQPQVSGKVSNLELEKLNNTKNGQFILMDEKNRINFELINDLIIDIQEKDLEVNLTQTIKFLPHYFTDYWLTSLLN